MKFIYQVVSVNGVEEFDRVKDLVFKYQRIGTMSKKPLRAELHGQPILYGLLGAMYNGTKNGAHVIRYETQEVYDLLSR